MKEAFDSGGIFTVNLLSLSGKNFKGRYEITSLYDASCIDQKIIDSLRRSEQVALQTRESLRVGDPVRVEYIIKDQIEGQHFELLMCINKNYCYVIMFGIEIKECP